MEVVVDQGRRVEVQWAQLTCLDGFTDLQKGGNGAEEKLSLSLKLKKNAIEGATLRSWVLTFLNGKQKKITIDPQQVRRGWTCTPLSSG